MARSNKTPTEMLAMAPENALSQASCVTFFAECAQWASIERHEQIKEKAWLGLVEQDRLCKRNDILMTLKAQLQAMIDIYSIEPPTPDPEEPVEPKIQTQSLTVDSYYDYPEKGEKATSPDINDMPALP